MGNDTGALAGTFGEYDQDDKEADEVWMANLLVCWHWTLRRLAVCMYMTNDWSICLSLLERMLGDIYS